MSGDLPRLWAGVAHVARERVTVLELAADAVRQDSSSRTTLCAVAVDEAEKLVGSLDSFGITGGSELAARAGRLLAQDAPDVDELTEVVARLRALVS